MMKKKIALSLLSIVSALAIMGGATFAFFSSSGTSSGNTFVSGTLTLNLDDTDEDAVDNSVIASISSDNFAPGASRRLRRRKDRCVCNRVILRNVCAKN